MPGYCEITREASYTWWGGASRHISPEDCLAQGGENTFSKLCVLSYPPGVHVGVGSCAHGSWTMQFPCWVGVIHTHPFDLIANGWTCLSGLGNQATVVGRTPRKPCLMLCWFTLRSHLCPARKLSQISALCWMQGAKPSTFLESASEGKWEKQCDPALPHSMRAKQTNGSEGWEKKIRKEGWRIWVPREGHFLSSAAAAIGSCEITCRWIAIVTHINRLGSKKPKTRTWEHRCCYWIRNTSNEEEKLNSTLGIKKAL